MLIAGYIGGTKTNRGIFSPEKGPKTPLVEGTYPSEEYLTLETLVKEFLSLNLNYLTKLKHEGG